jgi:lipoyl(octanoyl) transferase
MDLAFEDWGQIPFDLALSKQELFVEEVCSNTRPPTVVFCTHPPIVTKGRATLPEDIIDWTGPISEINRGGRATYHGPSQIIIYPIIPLKEPSVQRKANDIGAFLRQFELAIVDALHDIGITAQGKSYQPKEFALINKEETGVWVKNRKIASLGLSVRHWISFHGAALNVEYDPTAFKGLLPCGFPPSIMTSVEELLGTPPDRSLLISRLKVRLIERL